MEILLLLKIALLCFSLLVALCKAAKDQSNKSKEPVPRKPSGKVSHSYRTDPKNRALQADLLILLKGDVPAAKRLLLQQRRKKPGQSDNWYLEKVIYDLERDRR
ncbi:hypothetical protein [Nostoc sp. DSM 114167]|jgi:hypothetical protein|uniref:hypothetical protein n=1 Tax=Nostoc sp. DSM 114167 TaxID=3439050 RepID=UPI004045583D